MGRDCQQFPQHPALFVRAAAGWLCKMRNHVLDVGSWKGSGAWPAHSACKLGKTWAAGPQSFSSPNRPILPFSSHPPPPSYSLVAASLLSYTFHNTLTWLLAALTLFTRYSSLTRKSFFSMLEE